MTVETLKKLHTALVDTRGAYEVALKDTDDPHVAAICNAMISLRRTDHGELHQTLILAGETPDENGSFMSMLHETVISVRAAISGISKKTLPAFASGEEDILQLYDEALEEARHDLNISEILNRQRANLSVKTEEMKSLSR